MTKVEKVKKWVGTDLIIYLYIAKGYSLQRSSYSSCVNVNPLQEHFFYPSRESIHKILWLFAADKCNMLLLWFFSYLKYLLIPQVENSLYKSPKDLDGAEFLLTGAGKFNLRCSTFYSLPPLLIFINYLLLLTYFMKLIFSVMFMWPIKKNKTSSAQSCSRTKAFLVTSFVGGKNTIWVVTSLFKRTPFYTSCILILNILFCE